MAQKELDEAEGNYYSAAAAVEAAKANLTQAELKLGYTLSNHLSVVFPAMRCSRREPISAWVRAAC